MLVERMQPFTSTIFAEITQLAVDTGAINLGQGFPDTDGPASLLADAAANITGGINQYPPGPGVPALRAAVAAHQRRFYGLDVDPADVLVTVGATEAIASAVLSLCSVGDEVVAFEPFYDSYPAMVALSGATFRTVPLRAPDFAFDPDELRAAFSARTRMVLLNSPHNPTGAVFDRAQLQLVADLAAEHDAIVVSDEVYEHMTFDVPHIPIATLPGMAGRTLTISSAGKTFSVTGWKIGWLHGPSELVAAARAVKQFLTYTAGAPQQPAVAAALGLPDGFYDEIASTLRGKRELLSAGLTAAGFTVYQPRGTYFIVVDGRPLGFEDGYKLAYDLPSLCGVAAVPVSVFASSAEGVEATRSLVRFAFCKRDEVLTEAVGRLAGLRG